MFDYFSVLFQLYNINAAALGILDEVTRKLLGQRLA